MVACSVGHGENYSNCQQMLKGKLSITFLYMLDMYVCTHIDIDVSMHECMHVLCSYASELYVIVMKTMRISKKDLIIGGDVLTSSENLQQEGSYIGESVSEVCNFCSSLFHSSSHSFSSVEYLVLDLQFSLMFLMKCPIF